MTSDNNYCGGYCHPPFNSPNSCPTVACTAQGFIKISLAVNHGLGPKTSKTTSVFICSPLTLKCFQLIDLCDRFVLTSEVSHSKQGRGVIGATYQISNSKSYETSAVSLLSFCLLTPVLLVMLTVTRVRLLVLRSSPQIFKEKDACRTSIVCHIRIVTQKSLNVDEAY